MDIKSQVIKIYTIVLVLLIVIIFGIIQYKDKQYQNELKKYKSKIDTLIAQNELKDDKILNMKIDMHKREVLISSLKTKIVNGKLDTIYSLNHYTISPYGKLQYIVNAKQDTSFGYYIITQKSVYDDNGFIFYPNIAVIFDGRFGVNLSFSFFHIRRLSAEFGLSLMQDNMISGNISLNYLIISNTLLKAGVLLDRNLNKTLFIGVGANL